MTQLNDAKFDSLRTQGYTGAIGEMWLAWLLDNGATTPTIPDAEREVLTLNGYDTDLNTGWFEFLGDLGATGSLNDRWFWFWDPTGGGGTLTFKPISASFPSNDPTKLEVRLSDVAAVGSNVNLGVTITNSVQGADTVSGILQADRRYIVYALTNTTADNETVTFAYDSGVGTIVNDDAEALESGQAAATLVLAPVFSGPVGDYNLTLDEAGSKDYSTYFTGSNLTYAINAVPTGMTFNTATGLLSGTPTVDEEVTAGVVVTATNASGSAQTDAHSITVASMVYLLRATFDAYTTPATPVANGQVLAESGGDHAIEKGSMTAVDTGSGTINLENQKCSMVGVTGQVDTTGLAATPAPYQLGMTYAATIDNTLATVEWALLMANRGGSIAIANERFRILIDTTQMMCLSEDDLNADTSISLPYTPGVAALKMVQGGYTAGVPDPAGVEGCLYFLNDKLQCTLTQDGSGDSLGLAVQQRAIEVFTYDNIEQYADPAPLATPHRSLFATDHASIESYTPEDGSGWSDLTGYGDTLETTLGKARMVGGGSPGAAAAEVTDSATGTPVRYLESSIADHDVNNFVELLFRGENLNNGSREGWGIRACNNYSQISEYVADVETDRGQHLGITSSAPARVIAADDGVNITMILVNASSTNVVGTASSTAHATDTRWGMRLFGSGSGGGQDPKVEWICKRG